MVRGTSPPQVRRGGVGRTSQVELSKVQSEAADVLARSDGVGAGRLLYFNNFLKLKTPKEAHLSGCWLGDVGSIDVHRAATV